MTVLEVAIAGSIACHRKAKNFRYTKFLFQLGSFKSTDDTAGLPEFRELQRYPILESE